MTVGFGVIEGFYGTPWSFEARRRMIRFIADVGLGTYAYAPKSDPHHRSRWFEPLPRAELDAFASLAGEARAAGVRFVYGIAPQRLFGGRANLRVKSDADLEGAPFHALLARCASLVERGVDEFMVLFDDTWATVVPRLASFEGGRAHARIARGLARRLADLSRGPSPPIVSIVPAVYSGRAAELSRGARAYLRGLAAEGTSDQAVAIAWTGPKIFSPYISVRELEAHRALTERPVWIWNNAIANDWLPLATGEAVGLRARQHLCFGPVDNLAHGLEERTAGVLLNGAREPEATKVALASFADRLRLGTAYDSKAALRRGVERVYGAEAAPSIAAVTELVGGHPLAARHVAAAGCVRELIARARTHGDSADLHASLARLDDLEKSLAATPGGHAGIEEVMPTVRKIALGARALRAALEDDPRARALARQANAIPWATGLDPALALAEKGRFL